jgi:hypothetical protein
MAAVRRPYVVDPRLPVGAHVAETDPAHPNMITRNLLVVQNQAVADTKYDVLRPKRVYESFAAGAGATAGYWRRYGAAVLLPILLYIMLNTRQFAVKVVCAFVGIFVLHDSTRRLEATMRCPA